MQPLFYVFVSAVGLMKEELLMLNFYPRLEEKTMVSTGEYIFVVDRSGMFSVLLGHIHNPFIISFQCILELTQVLLRPDFLIS